MPAMHLPGGESPSVCVRFNPKVFEERAGEKKSPPLTDLPYRIIFAVASQDSVCVYDTDETEPICYVAGIHLASITDCAWSPDAFDEACLWWRTPARARMVSMHRTDAHRAAFDEEKNICTRCVNCVRAGGKREHDSMLRRRTPRRVVKPAPVEATPVAAAQSTPCARSARLGGNRQHRRASRRHRFRKT